MLQSREAELTGLTRQEMVIYLTLHKVTDAELVKKWYEKADARLETLRPGALA
jgi:hypothetical protein